MPSSEYWQEQQERQWSLPDALPSGERSWNRVFAILGFFVGRSATYSQSAPNLIFPLIAGVISAYIAGRYYKQILTLGVIAAIIWAINQNSATGEKPQSRPDPCHTNGQDIQCTTSPLDADFPDDIFRKAEQGYTVVLGFQPEEVKSYYSRRLKLPDCDATFTVEEAVSGDVAIELSRPGKEKKGILWRQFREEKRNERFRFNKPKETSIKLRSHSGQPATLKVWCRGQGRRLG